MPSRSCTWNICPKRSGIRRATRWSRASWSASRIGRASLYESGALTIGNVEPAGRAKLERADLNRFFSFGGFGSDSPDRAVLTAKAIERGIAESGGDLTVDNFISIGDTPRDVAAGHAAGIKVIGVATGHYIEQDLADAGADWVLATVENDFPV